MTIRVLHLVHRFSFGGTERVILNLLLHESPRVENYICSLTDIDTAFVKTISSRYDRLFSLNKKEGNNLWIPFRIAALCNQLGIDVLHSLGWGTYAEGICAKCLTKRKPAFIHSFRGKTAEDTEYIPMRRILAQRVFSHYCDAIITPSEESRRGYAAMIHIPSGKIRVVYNGVDVDHFVKLSPEKRLALRRRHRMGDHDVVIGTVGRFDPVKNISGLVRAFGELPERLRHKARLILVGGGGEEQSLRELVISLCLEEKVIFAGMQSDVAPYLNMMDIYAQPSNFEGVPNAVLEAMAAGLPVVATNVGGVPEVIEDGVTGILVEPHQVASLRDGIAGLMDREIETMGENGRRRTESLFSIQKMVDDYDRLYADIVAKRRKTESYV